MPGPGHYLFLIKVKPIHLAELGNCLPSGIDFHYLMKRPVDRVPEPGCAEHLARTI